MDEIKISVKALYEKAKEMLDDGMDTVTLSLCPPEGDGSDLIPAHVLFLASRANDPAEIDYEEIDAT